MVYIAFNFTLKPLLNFSKVACFLRNKYYCRVPSAMYSVYFMNGNDSRALNIPQIHQINQIIKSHTLKSSFLLYNTRESVRKYSSWMKTLPWITPHYAVKSNPSIALLKDFYTSGAGFDCASRSEIEAVLNLGVPLDKIVYSNSIKDQDDLAWAYHQGIRLTTADSIDELNKIIAYAPQMKILWRIAIKEEKNDNLATFFSGKFGDDFESYEKMEDRMRQIGQMGINLQGIHFHCGSGLHGSSAFNKAVLLARECMKIGRMHGHAMKTLDIGGGFPSGEMNQCTIQALRQTYNDPLGYRVIAQPGRHFSAFAFHLLTRVLGQRIKNGKKCYHLNQSLYHSFNCNIMDGVSFESKDDAFYKSVDASSNVNGIYQTQNSTLFGMTCDGMDIISNNISVPTALKVGDWICISGMGAYTYGCRSNFNGMKSTQVVYQWQADLQEKIKQPYAEKQKNREIFQEEEEQYAWMESLQGISIPQQNLSYQLLV